MDSHSAALDVAEVPVLLRGESEPIASWIERWDNRRVLLYVALIFFGGGL
jgi:hypothetical protein